MTVVGDDTDILVLLLYHFSNDIADIYLLSESKQSRRKSKRLISIRELAEKTSRAVLQNLLFIHAWGGCDSASAVYGHGKYAIIKIIQKFESVLSCCKTLADDAASYSQITSAGSQIFVKMYGGKPSDNLDYLSYIKYMKYAATSTKTLQPERLPPTERAAFFHGLGVHLQVMIWKSLGQCQNDPCRWGRKMKNGALAPVMTDFDPSPEELLKFVRCKCKVTSKSPCCTKLCSCLKHGLTCVTACSGCRGTECSNVSEATPDEEEWEEDANLFERLF